MITLSQPAGTSQSFITSTRPGETHDLGYHDPALVARRIMRGGAVSGSAPVSAPKVLPDQAFGGQKEPQGPESKNSAFGRGAVEAKPGAAAPAAAAEEAGAAQGGAAAEGAGLLGTIAKFLPLAL